MAVVGKKNVAGTIVLYIIVSLLTLLFIYPFYIVLVISLNDPGDLNNGYPLLFTRVFSSINYVSVFQSPQLYRAAFLTISRTLIVTFAGTFATAMLAYALSRENLIGKKFFNTLFLFILYFGGGLVATYIVYKNLGLINNFLVFILPNFFGVFYMLIIKSYYVGLPKSVEEAAVIDGCNDLQTFFRIIIPMSVPVLAAISVYNAVNQWNSWWDNYIFANKIELSTLQLLLVRLIKEADARSTQMSAVISETTSSPLGIRMATTVLVTIPILMVYPFFQNYFIHGITIGAVKG